MKQTIETAQTPAELGEKKEITLNCERLKIVDPVQLETGLAARRTYASNSVNIIESSAHGQKVKRNDELLKGAITDAIENISLAKNLGLDVADLEERFNKCVEEE